MLRGAYTSSFPQESSFLEQFHQSRQESIERTIDASPVASALCEWFEERKVNPSTKIKMTLSELLASLKDKKPDYAENWPRSPKGLGDALRRLAPALRYKGIDCRSLKKHGGQIFWEISCCDINC